MKASSGGKSTKDVIEHEVQPLTIPIRDNISVEESICCGFRQNMLDMRNDEGEGGEVSTGGGLGTDFITLQWNDRIAVIRGSELLRAWVSTFDPESAARFPAEVRSVMRLAPSDE